MRLGIVLAGLLVALPGVGVWRRQRLGTLMRQLRSRSRTLSTRQSSRRWRQGSGACWSCTSALWMGFM